MTITLLCRSLALLALFTSALCDRGCDSGETTAKVDESRIDESMTLVHTFKITLSEPDAINPQAPPGKIIVISNGAVIEDKWKLSIIRDEFPGTRTRTASDAVDDFPTKLLLYAEKSQAREIKARLAELTPEWRSANEQTLFVRKLDGLDVRETLGILQQAFPDVAFHADPTTDKLYILATEVESKIVLAEIRALQQQ